MIRKLLLLMVLLCVGGSAIAQDKKIVGKVIFMSDNEPVLGATVEVTGTKLATLTNAEGQFQFEKVPSNAKTIKVTYVGMRPVVAQIRSVMEIALEEDAAQLDEVMVVAFGEAKKSSFTGSASMISADKLTATQTSNITDALTGQVAGVQTIKGSGRPGSGSSVYIRGIGSFTASNSPLYIVDGSPYAGDIAAINPQDIASMTVMKDAAANALYGARGANGVIIITTKKGAKGVARVTLDAKWGVNRRGTSEYEVMKNPYTYMETLYKAMYNTRYDQLVGTMSPERAALQANQYVNQNIFSDTGIGVGYQMFTYPKGQNFIGVNGRVNPDATIGYNDGQYFYTIDNWENELLDSKNLRQEYNATVSGGTEKNDYFVSMGYIEDTGIIPKSGFNRYTARIKNDYRVKDWLRIGENISFTHYKYSDPDGQSGTGSSSNVFYVANNIAPIYSLYVRNAKGEIMKDKKGFPIYEYGDRTSSNIHRTFMAGSNPGSSLNLDQNYAYSNIFDATAYVEADLILPGLKARVSYNYFFDDSRMNTLTNKYYGQYSFLGGLVGVGHSRQTSSNLQGLLTYKQTFADKHTVDLMIGEEIYREEISSLSGQKSNMFSDEIVEIGNAISNPYVSSGTNKYATMGTLFRAQYDYESKYFGSFSLRRDASSRFSKENRWGTFWSLGGAWLIDREEWFKAKWVNLLKLKASYGEQGNDNIGNYYAWTNQYSIADVNSTISLQQVYVGNPDITWETSRNFNVGFDFELFKSRLNGTIEFFNRQTDDMLYARPTALSNGISSILMNIGSVRNRGVELDLNGTVIDNWHGLSVMLNLNATSVKNKIVKLAPELNGQYIDGNYLKREGGPMYSMYLRKWAGVDPDNGTPTWYRDITDANGNVTGTEVTSNWESATQYEIGDVMPDVYGGFGLTARYKGIDFGINFAYQFGGIMYDSGYASLMHNGNSGAGQNWHKDILKAWTEDNKYTDVPRLNADASGTYGNYISDRFLISSDYLSLNNITLGYTLPAAILHKIKLQKIRIYAQADNVALWSKRKGVDPRRSFTSSSNSEYSVLRTISGGITVEF